MSRHSKQIIVGRRWGFAVYAEKAKHVLFLGPTGSGKTSCAITTNVLNATESTVICASTKSDIFHDTWRYRRTIGPVVVLDLRPREYPLPEEIKRAWVSPLVGCDEYEIAKELASGVCYASQKGSSDTFWATAASALLTPLFQAASISQPRLKLSDVKSWVARKNYRDAIEILTEQGKPDLADQLRGIAASGQDHHSSIASVASRALDEFDGVRLLDADKTNFDPVEILDTTYGPKTLYIIVPTDTGTTPVTIVASVLIRMYAEMVHLLEVRRNEGHSGADLSVLWCLDEVANIARLEKLPQILSQSRAAGLSVVMASQSWSSIGTQWGTESVSMKDNTGVVTIWGRLNDEKYLEGLSALAGNKLAPTPGRKGDKSLQPRYTTHQLNTLPKYKNLVFSGRRDGPQLVSSAYYTKVWSIERFMRSVDETPHDRLVREGKNVAGAVIIAVITLFLMWHLYLYAMHLGTGWLH